MASWQARFPGLLHLAMAAEAMQRNAFMSLPLSFIDSPVSIHAPTPVHSLPVQVKQEPLAETATPSSSRNLEQIDHPIFCYDCNRVIYRYGHKPRSTNWPLCIRCDRSVRNVASEYNDCLAGY